MPMPVCSPGAAGAASVMMHHSHTSCALCVLQMGPSGSGKTTLLGAKTQHAQILPLLL